MSLSDVLLTFLCIVAAAVFFVARNAKHELSRLRETVLVLLDAHEVQRREISEQLIDRIQDLVNQSEAIGQELSEIRAVTDVIYKYKLPSKADREFLDQMEIDSEVSDRIFRPSSKA
jgi:hypothetical protein